MDVRSMMTLPVRVALLPTRIALHVLFAVGNRWMSTPTSPPIDFSPDTANGAEQCERYVWFD